MWPLYTPGTTDPPGVTGFFSSFSSTSTSAFTSYSSFSPTPPPPPPSYAAAAPLRLRAVVSIARARVRAYSRTCKVLYIARERAYATSGVWVCTHVRVCVCARALGRRVHTGRGARARFSSLSHVHIRASEPREEKGERKRDTLPSLVAPATAAARNRSLTRSHRHKLSRTRAHAPPMHTHKRRARAPIRFSDTIFPVGGNKSRLSCRAVRITVEMPLVVCFVSLRCTGNEIINDDERDNSSSVD